MKLNVKDFLKLLQDDVENISNLVVEDRYKCASFKLGRLYELLRQNITYLEAEGK